MVSATFIAMPCFLRACSNVLILESKSARNNSNASSYCTVSCLMGKEAVCTGAVEVSRDSLEYGRRSVSTACETGRHKAKSNEDGRGRSRIW